MLTRLQFILEGSFHSVDDVNIDPAFLGNTGKSWEMQCRLHHYASNTENLLDME